mmetsp:Transcript_62576/g.104156  ORF Transcript_62576/g.104156 Transcript_62576/m.104156 type:complete len:289 (-) Transcript_62576:181-1047(-)
MAFAVFFFCIAVLPPVSCIRPALQGIHKRRVVLHDLAISAFICSPEYTPAVIAPRRNGGFETEAREAIKAFSKGDYITAEMLWQRTAEAFPSEPLAWTNLGTCYIINASDEMTLGNLPEGEALKRLQNALDAFDKAEALGFEDGLLRNSKGNALGLLQRWDEAREAYIGAAAASPRDFESIPLSNAALVSFELKALERAEREARTLLRRDPNFVDAAALLATIRYASGDIGGAALAFEKLCASPQFCMRYSTDAVVVGRWTPRAVEAYRGLLGEPSIMRVITNSRALP